MTAPSPALTAADILVETLIAWELRPIDFAKAAEAMGGRGFTVSDPGQVDAVLDQVRNLHEALPETPGREKIEAALAAEPLRTMIEAGRK